MIESMIVNFFYNMLWLSWSINDFVKSKVILRSLMCSLIDVSYIQLFGFNKRWSNFIWNVHISVYCKEDKTMAYPMYFNATWYSDVQFITHNYLYIWDVYLRYNISYFLNFFSSIIIYNEHDINKLVFHCVLICHV
jgi:hypothetical protein